MKTKLINFTKSLIEKKSVTPVDDGAIKLLKKKLLKFTTGPIKHLVLKQQEIKHSVLIMASLQ